MLANTVAAGKAVGGSGAPEASDAEAAAVAEIVKRLARLRDPRNLVVALSTLTARRQVCPPAAAAVEARFLANGGAAFADLDARYLAGLVWACGVQGVAGPALYTAAVARAVALEGLPASDHANFVAGLARSGSGVALPPSVAALPELA